MSVEIYVCVNDGVCDCYCCVCVCDVCDVLL